jgi:GNAT superfamily N-acetyltransferase
MGAQLDVQIRRLEAEDVPAIRQVLEEWLIDASTGHVLVDEVDHRVHQLQGSGAIEAHRHYLVADAGEVIGVIGLQGDGIALELYKLGERPVEIVTAYVRRSRRGQGVGRALADAAEAMAREAGFSTLLVVSGSRNRASGYPFWRARYGQPVRVDPHYFGPGAERVVWRFPLSP